MTLTALHREISRTQGTREQQRAYDSLGRRILQRSTPDIVPPLPEQMILERAFRYTARGELSDVSDTLRGNMIYGYDEEGRLLKHYEASPGHSTRTFRYDAADNLLPDDTLPALPHQPLRYAGQYADRDQFAGSKLEQHAVLAPKERATGRWRVNRPAL